MVVADAVKPFLDRVAARRNERINARTSGVFTRSFSSESQVGDLLADIMRMTSGADIAFINSGGIRTNLKAGDLVYADVYEVSPFENYPAIVSLTGAQIVELIRLSTTGDHGIVQVSGLRYTFDA